MSCWKKIPGAYVLCGERDGDFACYCSQECEIKDLEERLAAATKRAEFYRTARIEANRDFWRKVREVSRLRGAVRDFFFDVDISDTLSLDKLRAAFAESDPVNQCDGCRAGKPLERGYHRMGNESEYPDLMKCERERYLTDAPRRG